MNRNPLISVITPVYNHAPFIEQTIRSVLSQTYANWEWIVLDDGSTDGTGEIIKRFKDSRIRYSAQEHAGVDFLTRTYNHALTFCGGDFIAMLDSDDYWPKDKLEVQVKYFDDSDVVLSYGQCWMVNQKGRKIYYMRLPGGPGIADNNPVGSSLRHYLFNRHGFIPNSTVMLRKDVLLAIGGFVEAEGHFQDFPTWTSLALHGKFAAVPRCLGYWRRHPSSISLNADPGLRVNARLNFIRVFVLQNKAKLNGLGFFYDTDMLEKRWEEIRKEYIPYLPYNRAMLMLRLGLLKEAQSEFKKFFANDPSVKHTLIYFLFTLSAFMRCDLVTPLAALKEKWKSTMGCLPCTIGCGKIP